MSLLCHLKNQKSWLSFKTRLMSFQSQSLHEANMVLYKVNKLLKTNDTNTNMNNPFDVQIMYRAKTNE